MQRFIHPPARREVRISHARELYYTACILVVIVGIAFSIWGPAGYLEMRRMERDLEQHRAKVESLVQSNIDRLRTVQGLRHDPAAKEKHLRDKGYARPDEIIQPVPRAPEPAPRPGNWAPQR